MAVAAQECVGLPTGVALHATALRNTDGGSRTWSAGGVATYTPRRIFAAVEGGQVRSSARLLSDDGEVFSGGLGVAFRGTERWHPCVMAGYTVGTEPSSPSVPNRSLNGAYGLAGVSFDIARAKNGAGARAFAAAQLGQADGSTSTLLRAGVLLMHKSGLFTRGGFEWGTDNSAKGRAFSASLGYRIR